MSQRFAADDSQRRCKTATGWCRAEINCLEGGQRERRERCFPSSYQHFPSLAARYASAELERDVLCLQRELHLSVPSLTAAGAQGLVPWHLGKLVAASSHHCPNLRAQSPAWLHLLARCFGHRQPRPSCDPAGRMRRPSSSPRVHGEAPLVPANCAAGLLAEQGFL